MSRHLTQSPHRSWMRVFRSLLTETAWGVGGWLTVAVLAVLPSLLVRGLWLVAIAEPIGDVEGATLSANAAGIVTWLAVVAGARRFVTRERGVGRHADSGAARHRSDRI